MKTKVIITGFSNAGKEGVTLHLNKRASLRVGGIKIKTDSFWVSWDKIGALLFDDYTDEQPDYDDVGRCTFRGFNWRDMPRSEVMQRRLARIIKGSGG